MSEFENIIEVDGQADGEVEFHNEDEPRSDMEGNINLDEEDNISIVELENSPEELIF